MLAVFLTAGIQYSTQAQIYAPEGLNMPGDWDDWTNPPSNPVLAGSAQTTSGELTVLPLGNPVYQTTFYADEHSGDIVGGSYNFKFTSGPLDNIWQNQWGNTAFVANEIQSTTYGAAGNDEPEPNTITLQNTHWYVMNWNNIGYENTTAIFMELDAEPVDITTVAHTPLMPTEDDPVEVAIVVTHNPATQENIYVRYTTNDWMTSATVPFTFAGTEGTATIPNYPTNTHIAYYVFTTTINNPTDNYDHITMRYNNNGGINYEYTVGDTLSCGSGLSLVSTEPPFPLEDSEVVITFNAELGNGGLAGYNDDVYAHTGVITNLSTSTSDWKYVKTEWGENTPDTKLTLIDSNMYEMTIPNIREYYSVPDGETIEQMAFVFRSAEPDEYGSYMEAKTAEAGDIFIEVYGDELNVKITYPTAANPLVEPNTLVPVCMASLNSDSLSLFIDNTFLTSTDETNLFYALNTNDYTSGNHWLIAVADDMEQTVTDSVMIFIRGDVPVAELPEGMTSGINYVDNNTVTLVLNDPAALKRYAFVIGDFNNWSVNQDSYMNRTPDGKNYWITLSGLTAGEQYAYQYYVDGELKLADPYCDMVLDPWNDKYIPESTYPNLKAYPANLTTGIVSVFQTAQQDYLWIVDNFTPVAVNETQSNLIIYELLVRDFVSDQRIASVMDSLDYLKNLGITAIELMPINEFEGNDSWGYNPSFYFAPDKAYGTKNDYKAFIDACHERGIAVILDMVLNHSFSQSPIVQMYWDSQNYMPTAQNPWYNQTATHPLSPGYDFNHESEATKAFVKRVFNYWVEEYKVDGFRLDLSKGFTQNYTGQDIGAWSQYDQSRINILTDYYNSIKATNPNTYMILEHLSDNSEEVALANTGMMLWGNMNEQFNQNTMGWSENSDYSWAYYNERGYIYPNLIPYMESHDEERLMYKNLIYGNTSGQYNIKDTVTALGREEAIFPMYYMVPGPKMIWQFGELGYDYSINYCNDGTISEDCRTQAKPVKWNYWNNYNRQRVYRVAAAMANLKKNNDAFIYGSYGKDISGLVKRAWLTNTTMNVVAGANMDVTSKTVNPEFQHSGTWYNYFTGETINASSSSDYSIDLAPGGYYVITDQKLARPFVDLTIKIVWKNSGEQVSNAGIILSENGSRTTGTTGEVYYLPNANSSYSYIISVPWVGDDITGSINVTEEDMTVIIEVDGNEFVEENGDENIRVYPNPANDYITIDATSSYLLGIYDMSGRVLLQQKVNSGTNLISTEDLNSGIYIIRIENGKKRYNSKIAVRK